MWDQLFEGKDWCTSDEKSDDSEQYSHRNLLLERGVDEQEQENTYCFKCIKGTSRYGIVS